MTTTFADLGVPTDIVAALAAHGIESPFAIQALTVADGCAGRDLCGRAPTGSGKTIAFGIPLATRTPRAVPKRPTALVLVPTRELASQVCKEVEWLGRSRRLRVAAVYGGAGYAPQLKALRRGVDVLVACPGRLTDLIERGEVFLDAVGMVVVDEADRMADMGFLPVVKRLLDQTSTTRQTLLFSATLDGAVDTLVRRYQNDPVRHLLPEDPEGGVRATHVFWAVEREERVQVCADLVRLAGPTIVFCKTKHGTDQLARKLGNLGVRADAIHGNRSQGQRERALDAFARGAVDALIATDVAARGIHVDGVACVLHFDPPNDEKDYTHRSGRTARAGAGGTVVSFVSTDQARDSARLQKALGLGTRVVTPDRAALASVTPESVSTRAIVEAPAPSRSAALAELSPSGPRGVVKWFDSRKGFGFIERHGADDLFVHCSEIQGTADRRLEEGQQVVFEIGAGRKGDEARKVRIAS